MMIRSEKSKDWWSHHHPLDDAITNMRLIDNSTTALLMRLVGIELPNRHEVKLRDNWIVITKDCNMIEKLLRIV